MERKKRSKGSVWEFWYANKIFGTFGFEMTACRQKLVKFCTLTHIHTTAAKLVVRICMQWTDASVLKLAHKVKERKAKRTTTGAAVNCDVWRASADRSFLGRPRPSFFFGAIPGWMPSSFRFTPFTASSSCRRLPSIDLLCVKRQLSF